MKKIILTLTIPVVVVGGLLLSAYLSNRTIDQTLATDLAVSSEWIEIIPDAPLTITRQVQEITLQIADFRLARNDHSSMGQVELPDGKIISPQIEVYDDAGKKYELRHTGYTMSERDLVQYTSIVDLPEDVRLTKLRIRSDEPFVCERLFWRSRNLK